MANTPVPAKSIPEPERKTVYPEPFATVVRGRTKRKLGDFFGLTNFGVNLTTLPPGSASALFHAHTRQDEFIYVLDGTPTLLLGEKEYDLAPGECVGFKAGSGVAHQLVNRSPGTASYLEIGDRTPGDEVQYPSDDLKATLDSNGSWVLTRKDGTPY